MYRLFSKCILAGLLAMSIHSYASQTVARQWNEALLQSIREDFARPTVHARNLFYVSVALYDAYAVFDENSSTYFLGKTVNGYTCPFSGIPVPTDVKAAQEEAMSYAAYRIMQHRFKNSPGSSNMKIRTDLLMSQLGYDINYSSIDYSSGSAAALGNYLGQLLINYGLQDGSNEVNAYANRYYTPVNPPLIPFLPGNDTIIDPNRWQPLTLDTFIDQSGHVLPGKTPDFLSPEWGEVYPFALNDSLMSDYTRGGYDYVVYHDPGSPPQLDTNKIGGLSEEYKWGFGLVSVWSSHLSSSDTTKWDISPASAGKVSSIPDKFEDFDTFYNLIDGGDPGTGHHVNPSTGMPYTPQIVKRGDYTRVLAEFWADGPDSETPPGHWFTILNYVNDHPALKKKYEGEGDVLDDLEWDVKSYFTLAGAMHDAAITAWGIKGRYDYIRPISAIRYMAGKGQSSDSTLPSYHPAGMQLVPGKVELVGAGDPLVGAGNQHLNKIKIYAWKGPDYINNPAVDEAGVDWILAENWWPYQRPSFITPPFAGFVSGHSTYSRAAAEVLTAFTGDEFFPGGMGEFEAKKNQFLVFEEGPSEDLTLQWATYRDASDQCSLSRIWGGIHPPADDLPGRHIGIEIGTESFEFAKTYFKPEYSGIEEGDINNHIGKIYPNPVSGGALMIELNQTGDVIEVSCYNLSGVLLSQKTVIANEVNQKVAVDVSDLSAGMYILRCSGNNWNLNRRFIKN